MTQGVTSITMSASVCVDKEFGGDLVAHVPAQLGIRARCQPGTPQGRAADRTQTCLRWTAPRWTYNLSDGLLADALSPEGALVCRLPMQSEE